MNSLKPIFFSLLLSFTTSLFAVEVYECGCYIIAQDDQPIEPQRHWSNYCYEMADLNLIIKDAKEKCYWEIDDARRWASSLNQFSWYNTTVKNCRLVDQSEADCQQ